MLRRNVLIFHAGALGDFVLAWPLALGLGRAMAQSRIIFVTHGQKGQLAERALRLESSDLETHGWNALHAEGGELAGRAATLLAGAQAVYTFLDPSPQWLQNVQRVNPAAKVVALSTRPPADYAQHATDWLLQQLAEHPVERAATEQMLRSINSRGVGASSGAAAASQANDVLIHPGSGSPHKCWPLDCYIELATALKNAGRSVAFITGEVEKDRWPAAHVQALKSVATVKQPATALELLQELSTARQFIGNDSGPAHLAGVLGVPTVAIFGPYSSPAVWRPLGPRVTTLSAAALPQITVEQVRAACSS